GQRRCCEASSKRWCKRQCERTKPRTNGTDVGRVRRTCWSDQSNTGTRSRLSRDSNGRLRCHDVCRTRRTLGCCQNASRCWLECQREDSRRNHTPESRDLQRKL